MIDLTMNEERLKRTVERARQRNIIIPTFEQMKNPDKVPAKIREKLKDVGLWDIDPANLFRITWKNDPVSKGGLYGE
ncbi:MAG: pyridoxal-5-phosphate-dependent protein subunit beta, partial [Thermovirgaceae bacterium]